MKMLNKKIVTSLIFACVILSGCAGKPINFNAVNQEIKISDVDFSKGRTISSEASGFQLLLFIPISINSRHERAYDSLLQKAGHDYISDIKIQESWVYAFVGTVYTTKLQAKIYPLKK